MVEIKVSPEDLEKARKYFERNISVGEILAYKELKAQGIKNPELVLYKLVEEGFIEKGEGCYNLVKKPNQKA